MPAARNRRHVVVPLQPITENYRPHGREIKPRPYPVPPDRAAHARTLRDALENAAAEASAQRTESNVVIHGAVQGCYIQFESPPDVQLKLASLEDRRQGIELRAVQTVHREDGAQTVQLATVFVPDGKIKHFITRFEQYATERTKKGEPKHKDLVDRIAALRHATLRALWTDEFSAYPRADEAITWEIWLRRCDGHELERFFEFAQAVELTIGAHRLAFYDRIIVLSHGTVHQLSASIDVLNDIAELRRAKQSAGFAAHAPATEQVRRIENLVRRTTPPPIHAPAVCILDTGVTRAHPLLEAVIAPNDATAVNPAWGPHDDGGGPQNMGHGTEMAGLAIYGDLANTLSSTDDLHLKHRLESVKILPPTGVNDPELYGAVTAQAVSRPEITAPDRPRVFSLTVTALDKRDKGQPTSWSASIDALSAGRIFDQTNHEFRYVVDGERSATRLFVVSAGNVDLPELDHLSRSDVEPVHDPAQAWNAITVGACTDKALIVDPAFRDWVPVAHPGELSPWSTTSTMFQDAWPIKPDIVFEGGNAGHDGHNVGEIPELMLLTTGFRPQNNPLVLSNATSAATAQVARMGAIIQAEYPGLWPEGIRALIVHSARWSPAMEMHLAVANGKREKAALVRRYGLGVPGIDRALRSANDALTLIVQSSLRPFVDGKMGEMHLHKLPWPIEALRELGGADVRLRLTLSYFVEPNPSRRGWNGRYRYASHGLRFDVKSPSETIDNFRKRLNQRALDEDEKKPATDSQADAWVLGEQTRNKGSIHSDIWRGTAADLAECGIIGVYPVSGWWKDQPKRDRSHLGAPYALVATIETDAEQVDLWTPVAVQLEMPVEEVMVEW